MKRRRKKFDHKHVLSVLASLGVLLGIAYNYDKAWRKQMQNLWSYISASISQSNTVGFISELLAGGKALINNAVDRLLQVQLPDLAKYVWALWSSLNEYVHRLMFANGVTKHFPHVFASGTEEAPMSTARAEQIQKGISYLDNSVHISKLQKMSNMQQVQNGMDILDKIKRRALKQLHTDKGGDQDLFISVKEAFSAIKSSYILQSLPPADLDQYLHSFVLGSGKYHYASDILCRIWHVDCPVPEDLDWVPTALKYYQEKPVAIKRKNKKFSTSVASRKFCQNNQHQTCVVVGVDNCQYFKKATKLAKQLKHANTFCCISIRRFRTMAQFKLFCAQNNAPLNTSPVVYLTCSNRGNRRVKWIGGYSDLTMLDLRYMSPGTQLSYAGAFGIEAMHHHALYIGHGKVIHFSGGHANDDKRNATVILESLKDFIANVVKTKCTFVKRHERSADADDTEAIVDRCLELVGTKSYNLMNNNCEDLVEYCLTGQRRSRQREQLSNSVKLSLQAVGSGHYPRNILEYVQPKTDTFI